MINEEQIAEIRNLLSPVYGYFQTLDFIDNDAKFQIQKVTLTKHTDNQRKIIVNDVLPRLKSLLNSENVKRVTKPDPTHEIIHDDRDSMRAEQAVDTDTEGFGGDPIEYNIHSENIDDDWKCRNGLNEVCSRCKEVKDCIYSSI